MWRVPIASLRAWAHMSGGGVSARYPTAADVVCPHCGVLRGFSFSVEQPQLKSGAMSKTLCPGCGQLVRFWVVDATDEDVDRWPGSVWMHPDPVSRDRLPIDGLLPERLVKDYDAARAAFEHGIWRAAAQMARTVLEGVVTTRLGEPREQRPLGQLLQRLAEVGDLGEPIRTVGTTLRDGGNVASHFDDGHDVSAALAGEMLDLLDAFIEYLIILPERTTRLTEMLQRDTTED